MSGLGAEAPKSIARAITADDCRSSGVSRLQPKLNADRIGCVRRIVFQIDLYALIATIECHVCELLICFDVFAIADGVPICS
jgi:hypothetical protein